MQHFDFFLAATSFEQRSLAVSQKEDFESDCALVFRYEDALGSEQGMANTRLLHESLQQKTKDIKFVHCDFRDAYSALRSVQGFFEGLSRSPRSILVDITCFTKVHLLLILRFLDERFKPELLLAKYAEPLIYGTSFGRRLTRGIWESVYIQYVEGNINFDHTGLIIFLGHEYDRAERIIQELQADEVVMVVGTPGFTSEMAHASRRLNKPLLSRARWDGQLKIRSLATNDPHACCEFLVRVEAELRQLNVNSIYISPMGTKLQSLGIHLFRKRAKIRTSIAYTIPTSYDQASYSLGIGEIHTIDLGSDRAL